MKLRLDTYTNVEGVTVKATWWKGGIMYQHAQLVDNATLIRRGYADELYYVNKARNEVTAHAIKHYYGS